jgi:hypothetical protein
MALQYPREEEQELLNGIEYNDQVFAQHRKQEFLPSSNRRKIFSSCSSGRGLISRLYKEFKE